MDLSWICSINEGDNMKEQIITDLKQERYTLKDLAKHMDVSNTHLCLVLNGQRPMSYKVASALCESLNALTSNTYNLTDFGY